MYNAYIRHGLSSSTRDGTWDDFLQTYYAGADGSGMPVQHGPAQRAPQKANIFAQEVLYLPLVQR
jgi:hypothetical protein